ncbi:MAG: YgfZ/GcvT domain-containing protein [Rickettsiales bacterium]
MNLIDPSRALIAITGEDAANFLQGIITQDIAAADTAPIFSAMLSPQGKWNYDFFIIKREGGYWLDVRANTADALIKKLSLYKLRAKVSIAKIEGWNLSYIDSRLTTHEPLAFADPRHSSFPSRHWSEVDKAAPDALSLDHVLIERLNHGLPEGGTDVTENETLLDVGYDLLNAVSFTKGCYIGQEVTARMHYKSIARKGFYHVQAADTLSADTHSITRDGKVIGELRSRHLNQGLMFARFDVVGEGGEAFIGNLAVTLSLPKWLEPRYQMHLKNQEA